MLQNVSYKQGVSELTIERQSAYTAVNSVARSIPDSSKTTRNDLAMLNIVGIYDMTQPAK